MMAAAVDVERRCAQVLRHHLETSNEGSLSQAYEFGRWALGRGLGVLDMAMLLSHAVMHSGLAGDGRAAPASRSRSRAPPAGACPPRSKPRSTAPPRKP